MLAADGATAEVIALGAALRSLRVPGRRGEPGEVTVGLPDVAAYEASDQYAGAVVGRYANRIAGAAFELDGRRHGLAANDGRNALHGGARGFDQAVWAVEDAGPAHVLLRHASPGGDQGFPGRLEATARYALAEGPGGSVELRLDLAAWTDALTVASLTSHAYWNLGGPGLGSALGHELEVQAARYLPVDGELIPTGELAPVEGTPFDFRRPLALEARIREPHPQLLLARGYDHCLVLDGGGAGRGAGVREAAAGPRPAARLRDPASGRTLELLTTAPGLQLYSGNVLDGTLVTAGGHVLRQGDAVCLEPQLFPDGPNRPEFPRCELRPGEQWRQSTVWRFSAA